MLPYGVSMDLPAKRSHEWRAARRLARLPLSGLIAEWEEQLLESERCLLAKELETRGYRMKSLSTPTDDVPDSNRDEVKWLLEERPVLDEPLPRKQALFGAAACYAIVIAILLAPAFHLLSLGLVVLYLTLGIAIQWRSRMAAVAALALTGAQLLGLLLLALVATFMNGLQSEGGTWIWLGLGTLVLAVVIRTAASLSRRPSTNEAP